LCRKAKRLTSGRGTPGNGLFTKPQETRASAHCDAAAQQNRPPDKRRERDRRGSKPVMMRALVVVLAVLAGVKLWTQERLYRDGAREALLMAYRDRAIAACQMSGPDTPANPAADPIGRLSDRAAPASTASLPLWTRPSSVSLAIGRSSAAVNIWEINNELWPARFKHPHVVLTASDRAPHAVCEYDVIEGRAYLTQL
jgi:hypothetical protein